jgi:hypothetical protein
VTILDATVMTTMKQIDYTRCWANCLGDCDGGISREHIVSECLFDSAVKVKGLPWCKDKEKEVGIGSLTSKILCRHHNQSLSTVDGAAKQTLATLREASDLWLRRKDVVTKSWSFKPHYTTDMLLLERWCLKTLINVNLNRKPSLPFDAQGSLMPTKDLVRIAFGLERFTPPMGLYRIAVNGEATSIGDKHIHLVTKSRNDILAGAEFKLWGLPFFLSLVPQPIRWEGGRLMRGQHKQWFCTRDRKQRNVQSHLMTFTYPNEAIQIS